MRSVLLANVEDRNDLTSWTGVFLGELSAVELVKELLDKVTFALEQAIKAQKGNKVVAVSLTSALDGDGWLTPRPGRYNPGKESRYPFYRRLGGHQCRCGQIRQNSPTPEFDPRTVQPVASRYID